MRILIIMTIQEIYDLTIGKRLKVTTDSRTAGAGTFFVGLRGERLDGNSFTAQVLEQGTAYAIIDNPEFAVDNRCILVENSLKTLQGLATIYRKQFSIPVIAIGGSNGKTTTKELIAAVLGSRFRIHVTAGNLNNEIGTPLTILAMPMDTEIGIIEIGANHSLEHTMLMNIVQPTHVLVTNNGADHLEGFGSLDGVRAANREIYDWVATHGGVAFVNKSLPDLVDDSLTLDRILYPAGEYASTSGSYASVRYGDIDFTTQLFGSMNEANILGAIAVGEYFGIPLDVIQTAIAAYIPTLKRSQIIQKGSTTIILDCYNANPSSMELSLQDFFKIPNDYKLYIIGDMLELGEAGPQAHHDILTLIQKNIHPGDHVICVGPIFSTLKDQFPFQFFLTSDDAQIYFETVDTTNTHIFVKGSRGIKLETIIHNFL